MKDCEGGERMVEEKRLKVMEDWKVELQVLVKGSEEERKIGIQ